MALSRAKTIFYWIIIPPMIVFTGIGIVATAMVSIWLFNGQSAQGQSSSATGNSVTTSNVEVALRAGSFYVDQENYPDWPFANATSGIVSCKTKRFGATDRPVVTVTLGVRVYGLNGAALGVARYPDTKPIRLRDEWGQASVGMSSVGAWIKQALLDCPEDE